MRAPRKQKILLLAANASGADRRASLDREAHAIRVELRRSGYRDRFEFEARWAAEPLDLLRELRELKPAVVHFYGESGPDGLRFGGSDGAARLISAQALADTFGAVGASVQLVVLNACYSDEQAEALLAHVDCVVGIGGSIHRDAARIFAIGFYGGLGERASVAAAYRQGRTAIRLEGLPEADHPRLKVRPGIDADQLVPATIAPPEPAACPYPGMQPYSADDADHFHGRDAEIDELIGRLRMGEREIYVIGPSGSGKSSLVAAGVLPRLARGAIGPAPFVVRSMRPGEHPIVQLGEALEVPEGALEGALATAVEALLAHRGAGASVLLVIDQLEELFALASAGERARFLGALAALRGLPRCVVVFTLRADFYGHLMESPLWTDRRGRISRIEVGPLRGDALREAIGRPARDLGVDVEPELIERLSAEAGSEPGILPLLQETLVQLWDRRQDQLITLADYQVLGDRDRSGLAVALARRADATVRALTPAQEAIARRILLRLISFGEGRSDTRRQQPRSKLRAAGDDADFDAVLHRLIADRLLATDDAHACGEPRVDLAHEVMITAWPTLAGWLQTRRTDEQHRRQLEAAAARWAERGRGDRGLLDPIELAEAEAWRQTESARELGESADVAALILASRATHDRQRKLRRFLVRSALVALAVFAGVVAILAFMARHQAARAEASRNQAERLLAQSYQESGRQLLLDGHPQEAMPYLVAARRMGERRTPLQMLFWTATRSLPLVPALAHQGAVVSAAFSADGTRVVTVSEAGSRLALRPDNDESNGETTRVWDESNGKTVRVWDAATGTSIFLPFAHQGLVRNAAFSPDATHVITMSDDGTARVWEVATGKSLPAPRGPVQSAAFSPDGARIVTASFDRTARVWDVATGKLASPPLVHREPVRSAAFSPDGTRVITLSDDRTARIWDATAGTLLADLREAATHGAVFSPDSTRVVTANWDDTARVWDATTGKLLAAPLKHQAAVRSAAFSPDGTRIVTAGNDRTARIWDAATGEPLTPPLEHQAAVRGAAFSPDGARIVTASDDRTAQIWDAATGKPLGIPLRHQGAVRSAAFGPDGIRVVTASDDHTALVWNAAVVKQLEHRASVRSTVFSPDGTRVVTAGNDSTARVWDATTGKLLTSLPHGKNVNSAAFSPDGTRIVTASDDGTARVWNATTGEPVGVLLEHPPIVWSAAVCADGARVVTAGADRTARVWEIATGKLLATIRGHEGVVRSAVFSPDGTRVVTASDDQTARIWKAATGELLATIWHQETVRGAAFSPDGTRVVTASWDDTARVWDAATENPLPRILKHAGDVRSAAFSPDGDRIITASSDNTARIWDAATGRLLVTLLEHQGAVSSAAFSPDGARVVTASDDRTARVWDAATGKLLATLLEHRAAVHGAAFSADGTHVVTASDDNTARIWDTRCDQRTLPEWDALAKQSPFVLSDDGVLLPREIGGD